MLPALAPLNETPGGGISAGKPLSKAPKGFESNKPVKMLQQ